MEARTLRRDGLGEGALLGRRKRKGFLALDPRTLMGVLVAASVLAFAEKSLTVELCLVCAAGLLQALAGYPKMAAGLVAAYAALLGILCCVFPNVGGVAATMFTISFTFSRKIYLCLMVGALLVSDSSVHRLGAALAKLRLPQTVLVPLTVTLRYFPTLKEEASHIRDAMALREIPLRNRAECFAVPLVMSAAQTAEELARAATCRGIENPAPSTDTERLTMRASDWTVLGLSALAVALTFLFGGSF